MPTPFFGEQRNDELVSKPGFRTAMKRVILRDVASALGIERAPATHAERWISGIGGFVGILLVAIISTRFVDPASAGWVVASMGASAVLLFAVPHGTLSQPWAVFGGHVVSAVIGVACYRLIPDMRIAGPASVGLAIGAMYYLRCIHPPGGATALTAVLGGPGLHALGYHYLLTPVLLNTTAILVTAVLINAPFPWRRYPAALARRHRPVEPTPAAISHEHLAYARRQMGSLIDVSEDDLTEIYALAHQHAAGTHLSPEQIRVGGCYTNGRTDARRSVRQVVDELPGETPDDDVVLYWVVAGEESRGCHVCTRAALALWARAEVSPEKPAEFMGRQPQSA